VIKQLKILIKDFKHDIKNLKKLILTKKAGAEEISYLKMNYLLKLLQAIFKRKRIWKRKNAQRASSRSY
jgi:hypothetical protein